MRKFFPIFFFFWLLPALTLANDINIEGRVFTETGPMEGIKVYVYKNYDDINSGTPFLISEPTDKKGLYRFQLPPGEYFFTAKGNMDGKEFYAYHGKNPIKVETENIWLTFMINETKPPVYSDGDTSLKGVVTYKGSPVKDAYITLYTPETKKFKGLGYRTESINADGTFNLSLTAGKYIVVAKKKETGKKMRPLKKGDLFCYYPLNPIEVKSNKVVRIEVPCYPKGDRSSFAEAPPIKTNDYTTVEHLADRTMFGIKGKIRDLEGNPVAKLFVLAYRSKQSPFLMHYLSDRTEYAGETDREGNYFIPIDADGDFYIIARNTLGGSPRSGDVYGFYEGTATHSVSFRNGQIIENIDIVVGKVKDKNSQQLAVARQLSGTENQKFEGDTVVDRDTFWKGNILIDGMVVVKRGVTLTIEPGTIISFNKRDRDKNGIGDSGIMVEGRIVAHGTKDKKIIFTSASEKPEPRDWSYIMVLTAGPDNIFEYCEVHYAFTGLQIQYSNATITDCFFNKNYEGLRFNSSNLVVEHNSFLNNNVGIGFAGLDGKVIIRNNIISNNNVGVLFMRPRVNSVDFKKSQKIVEMPLLENNNINSNHEHNFKIGESQSMDIDVTNNWWGSIKKETIEELLFDKKKNYSLGQVIYSPYLVGPVQNAGVRDNGMQYNKR
jgi:hypothetical protein